MRIAVYPHDLEIGGSQLNAIEIAAEIRRRGHEILVIGRPGSLVSRIAELGLEFVELPAPSKRPSRRVAHAIRDLIETRGIDIVHGFEWPPTLEAVWACQGNGARPCSTVMSMAVAPFIPRWVPLFVGTEQIAAVERSHGRREVELLEPPVDLTTNDPEIDFDIEELRRSWGWEPETIGVGLVTRLAHEMKLEGVLAAIKVVGQSRDERLRLVIAGDGPARAEVDDAVNALPPASRHRVVLTGELADPRPVYAAVDISLGMGGSALRAMAFGKPLVVQGEQGFWCTLDEKSVAGFLWTGWYGAGPGRDRGVATLSAELEALVADSSRRAELGVLGRRLVEDRFSIEVAADRQIDLYQRMLGSEGSVPARALGTAEGLLRYAAYYARKRAHRILGRGAADDFNARPVAADRGAPSSSPSLWKGIRQ